MSDVTVSSDVVGGEGGKTLVGFARSEQDVVTLRDMLVRLKRPQVQVFPGGIDAAQAWCEGNTPPHILLVDLEGEAWPLLKLETLLEVCGPTCQVVSFGNMHDVSLYRSLLQLGITDYLVKPYPLDLLSAALAKCEGQQSGPEYARLGRTVAIAGASGGVGVSTIAAGLSRLLSQKRHLPVALVDFDRRHGDQLLLLRQSEDAGLSAVLASEELDTRLLQRAMLPVDSRLHLLAQKPSLQAEDAVDVEAVLNLGGALCRMFNQVVWDLPNAFPAGALEVLTYAELRILVTDLTVQDARNVRRILLEIGDESEGQRLLLVHNQSRASGQTPLSRAQFTRIIGRDIDITLPYAGHSLAQSLTLGALNASVAPAWQQALRNLADLACGHQPSSAKKHWITRLLKRA